MRAARQKARTGNETTEGLFVGGRKEGDGSECKRV
jgi:hypothetical protein